MLEFLTGLVGGGLLVGLIAVRYYQPKIDGLVLLIQGLQDGKEKVDVLRGTF